MNTPRPNPAGLGVNHQAAAAASSALDLREVDEMTRNLDRYLRGELAYADWMAPYLAAIDGGWAIDGDGLTEHKGTALEQSSRDAVLKARDLIRRRKKHPEPGAAVSANPPNVGDRPGDRVGVVEVCYRVFCGGPCHVLRVLPYRSEREAVEALRSHHWRPVTNHGWVCPICRSGVLASVGERRQERAIERALDNVTRGDYRPATAATDTQEANQS